MTLKFYGSDGRDVLIADEGGWLPGIYDSIATAREAAKLSYQELHDLSERICHVHKGEGRIITLSDLPASVSQSLHDQSSMG